MEAIFNDYISPFFLAILQGITEFLPVSSSGHLVLLDEILPLDSGMLFDLVLHLATLMSVVVFYWKDIKSIFLGCIHEFGKVEERPNLKFVGFLLVATVITGVIGIALKDYVEHQLRNVMIVGALLIVNSLILLASRKQGLFKLSEGKLNLKTALLIGLAQGVAVLPGISRSGSTITTALLVGIESKECAKISFLLSIPAILGAFIFKIPEMKNLQIVNLGVVLAAAVVASIVGYFCLKLLNNMLKKANFYLFAPYCFVVGLLALIVGIWIL